MNRNKVPCSGMGNRIEMHCMAFHKIQNLENILMNYPAQAVGYQKLKRISYCLTFFLRPLLF